MAPTGKESDHVLAFDLGGTKVLAAVVNTQNAEILIKEKRAVDHSHGPEGLADQLADLGRALIDTVEVPVHSIGLASAGPLDPVSGRLLDPTNYKTDGKSWGPVPIVELIEKRLERKVVLENDAAAAALAEAWVGKAQGYRNAMVLTLGTGLGTGILVNGKLVRAREQLHPEAGHLIISESKEAPLCGCGNRGCAEAFLSGKNFSERLGFESGQALIEAAKSGDSRVIEALRDYSRWMALAIRSYAVVFAPEIVVFTGGFAPVVPLIMDDLKAELEALLERRRVGFDLLPELKVSELGASAGVLGAGRAVTISGMSGGDHTRGR